jgi:AhpD family alkylhydroperoxidase
LAAGFIGKRVTVTVKIRRLASSHFRQPAPESSGAHKSLKRNLPGVGLHKPLPVITVAGSPKIVNRYFRFVLIGVLITRASHSKSAYKIRTSKQGCAYCIASHAAAARKAGMSEAMFGEVMAVTGMANETNRLANGYRVPIDPAFQT